MDDLIRYIHTAPDRLRRQLERNAVAGAALIDRELKATLGRQGSRGVHSSPGQPPFRQSGEHQASAFARAEGLTIVCGAAAPHARHVARLRPFIDPTLDRIRAQLDATLTRDL